MERNMENVTETAKESRYGLRGELRPKYPFEDHVEELSVDGMKVIVENGVISISYDSESDEVHAGEIIKQLLHIWSFRNEVKITADLNQRWHLEPQGNKNISLSLSEEIKATDFVLVTTISSERNAKITGKAAYDSRNFENDLVMLTKSSKDASLKKALEFYYEEVIDSKRPLYGVYKAVEELYKNLGGMDKLANLAGKNKKYVEDIKQTAETTRHARTLGKKKLSLEECKERAKTLIEAYARSIKE